PRPRGPRGLRALGASLHADRRGDRARRAARVLRRRPRREHPGAAPHRRLPPLRRRATPAGDDRRGHTPPAGRRGRLRAVRPARGIAMSLDGPAPGERDPFASGYRATLESALNVACAGGEPLALTDCLNFGNPERGEIGWELARAIDGIAQAAAE